MRCAVMYYITGMGHCKLSIYVWMNSFQENDDHHKFSENG